MVNLHALDYFGQTLDELKHWGTNDTVHSEDLPHVIDVFSHSIATGSPYEIVQRFKRFDGVYRWFKNAGHPLRDASGKIVQWCVLLTDIDALKRAEDSVRKSESDLNLIVSAIPALAWSARPDGNAEFFNKHYLDFIGLSEKQAAGWGWTAAVHPEDLEGLAASWQRILASGQVGEAEARLRRYDGEYRWFIFRASPLTNEQGQIVRWYGANTDIEDRRRAEAERKQIAETFRTIVETNPECVKVIDRDGTLQRVNAAGLVMSGAPSEEAILGQCFYDFVVPDDRDRYREFNEQVCSGHKGFLEFDLINAQGRLYHMETHAAPMPDADGSMVQLGVTRDITERKRNLEQLQANQDLLELAQKSAGAIAFDWHIQEEINVWSPEQEALYGLLPGKFDGTYHGWKSLIYDADWPAVLESIEHAKETGSVAAEFRVIWPDGTVHWLATNGRMFFDDRGTPFRMVGFSTDITRRKVAEGRLASEKRLLELVATGRPLAEILTSLCSYVDETSPDCHCGIYLMGWDPPKVHMAIGPSLPASFNAALDNLEFTSETGPCAMAATSKTQVITVDVESDPVWEASVFREVTRSYGLRSCWSTPICSRSGEVFGTFAIYQSKPGSPTPLQQDLIAQVTHIASIAIERAQREDTLRRNEAFLAEGQHLARLGNYAWNVATGKITWSEQLYRIFGSEPGTSITFDLIRSRVHPDDVSLYEKMVEHAQSGGDDFEWQYRLLMPDNSVKYLHAVAHATQNEQGEVEYFAAVQDITARVASQEQLQRSEAELRRANQYLTIAQELSQTGSYTRDVLTDEQTLSDEMYRIMDLDPAKKVTHEMVLARVHPDDLAMFKEVQRKALATGKNFESAYRIVTSDGTVKYLRSSSRRLVEIEDRLVYVGATQDVTEIKRAEEALDEARSELAYAARAMSLGVLTASIAHEVNQPLSGIITNASTCVRMLDIDPPNVDGARETARRTIRDGNRAAEVITRLRAMFRKENFSLEPIDLSAAAEEVVPLTRSEMQRNHVLVESQLATDLPLIDGDRVQLQQVILNLLLNAADAMSGVEDRPRKLTLVTHLEAADRVRLSVKDVGTGFLPEAATQLFEAFYTTKQKGMGIGLSVSRSIIESHHGRIWAEPNQDGGAVFSFSIPVRARSMPTS